jgi:hypothetical protein
MAGEDREFSRYMATLDRLELLVIFASFLIGSAAGWWSRMHWQSSIAAVGATLIGTVAGYLLIAAALRAAGHPVR